MERYAHHGLHHKAGTIGDDLGNADKSLYQIRDELNREEGIWVAYLSENPNTRTDQLTRTYLSEHDGYIFGADYYFPDSRIQSMVDSAIYAYRASGEAAFDTISSGALNSDNLFPIVRNATHAVAYGLADRAKELGFNNRLIGPLSEVLSESDAKSAHTVESNLATAKQGGTTFTHSLSRNPATQTEQVKLSYGALYDGYIFSSAYSIPDADAQSVVDYALFIYESNKDNDAWINIITPDDPIITDAIYPFVLNATDWSTVAHGTLPDLVGKCCSDDIQETSVRPFEDIRANLDGDGTAWVEYTFYNPNTGTDQLKRTWLVERDGLIFGAGYYILDSRVQAIAYSGTLDYDQLGEDGALAKIVTGAAPNVPYLFVVDPNTGKTRAQGVAASVTGSSSDWAAAIAAEPNLLDQLEEESGTFVTYQFVNPRTGQDESKRAWLTMHEDLIFGAGYSSDAGRYAAFLRTLFG